MYDYHAVLQKLCLTSSDVNPHGVDKIVELTKEIGAFGAKSSGGSGGGKMTILPYPENMDKLMSALRDAGFQAKSVKVTGTGVMQQLKLK